ncbi:hypothetical protein [Chryseobacterium daeguense]|uniref:hypothetical protein n=1 Tax=Chryseobacterium daeguense TaxID=412438 RepID=UPI000685D7A7|nr:hypothetical protein [Chryseobacterium daeguense]
MLLDPDLVTTIHPPSGVAVMAVPNSNPFPPTSLCQTILPVVFHFTTQLSLLPPFVPVTSPLTDDVASPTPK